MEHVKGAAVAHLSLPNPFASLVAPSSPSLKPGDSAASPDDRHQDSAPTDCSTVATSMGQQASSKPLAVESGVHEDLQTDHPRNLVELPVDILDVIMREITHTNDLCAIALTCTALNALATPHIYSRFDIVWPDAQFSFDGRPGVDALTHGLATLVMRDELPLPASTSTCDHCGHPKTTSIPSHPNKRRRGNDYACHTKKFSLGNGPFESIKDYNIKTEAGKMLGTLAALAIARMRNLETFIWDMPTGIVRDVWLALASLEQRAAHEDECRLQQVWVRFHDNHPAEHENDDHLPPPTAGLPPHANHTLNVNGPTSLYTTSTGEVERPTFAILPAVKALSVVDIDELAYLDEMSALVAKSRSRLRTFRIGISKTMNVKAWVENWDNRRGPSSAAVRTDGILGTLFCQLDVERSSQTSPSARRETKGGVVVPRFIEDLPPSSPPSRRREPGAEGTAPEPSQKLALECLALERVPINMKPLRHWINWATLTELTLLNCEGVEQLWKMLRKRYSPKLRNESAADKHRSGNKPSRSDFALCLRSLHVNDVSTSFLQFVKDALAPNTVEVLFLQDKKAEASEANLEQIFKHAIKRHRLSLVKLSIDSIPRPQVPVQMGRARKWALDKESLRFVISGNMPVLREVCFSIDYSNWHFLVHRLQLVPHIRSLYIPTLINDLEYELNERELALQAVDAIALRPEIELCYIGIISKCFEILEGKACDEVVDPGQVEIDEGDDEDEDLSDHADDDDDDAENDDDDDDNDDDDTDSFVEGGQDSTSELLSGSDEEEEEGVLGSEADSGTMGKDKVRLRLREILFYDDKVSIFKIRHGRL